LIIQHTINSYREFSNGNEVRYHKISVFTPAKNQAEAASGIVQFFPNVSLPRKYLPLRTRPQKISTVSVRVSFNLPPQPSFRVFPERSTLTQILPKFPQRLISPQSHDFLFRLIPRSIMFNLAVLRICHHLVRLSQNNSSGHYLSALVVTAI
jgi:hypothetical protein